MVPRMIRPRCFCVAIPFLASVASAQDESASAAPEVTAQASVAAVREAPSALPSAEAKAQVVPVKAPAWYEKLLVRGYTQLRYNNLLQTAPGLVYPQNDKGIGGNAGFTIRRARLVLSGEAHPRVSFYFQTEFSADAGSPATAHVAQIRDLYTDVALDDAAEFRLRLGQSKIPFGFENLQSSGNRAPLDRTEAMNSATPGERELGAFAMWAPKAIRARFKHLVDAGLKGSGDYGVVALGVYNGQGINKVDATPSRAVVARVTWPFDFGGQFVEVSAQAMMGDLSIALDPKMKVGTKEIGGPSSLNFSGEKRAALSLVIYPQPFGFQAEAQVGRGPVFDLKERTVLRSDLFGYYAMLFGKFGDAIPYLRYAHYTGSRRTETNALATSSDEFEGGVEYSFNKALEVTAAWQYATRFNQKSLENTTGSFARVQVQFNF